MKEIGNKKTKEISDKTKTRFLEKIEESEYRKIPFNKELFKDGYCVCKLGIGERVELEGRIKEISEEENEIDHIKYKDYTIKGENFMIGLPEYGRYKTSIEEYKGKKVEFYTFYIPYSSMSISLIGSMK